MRRPIRQVHGHWVRAGDEARGSFLGLPGTREPECRNGARGGENARLLLVLRRRAFGGGGLVLTLGGCRARLAAESRTSRCPDYLMC